MLVSIESLGNIANVNDCELMEVNTDNRVASEYIGKNYEKLVRYARTQGIKDDKAYDVVGDMLVKLLEAEAEGRGFNEQYGDGLMSIEQFIYARLRMYTRNDKYRSDIVEKKTDKIEIVETVVAPIVKANGEYAKDRKGNIKTEKKNIKTKKTFDVYTVAACPTDTNEYDDLDAFQKAYATAAIWDDGVDYDTIRQSIELCIDICEPRGFNVLSILKNVDTLSDMINSGTRTSVFKKFGDLVSQHSELAEAFKDLMNFSSKYRELYDRAVACY